MDDKKEQYNAKKHEAAQPGDPAEYSDWVILQPPMSSQSVEDAGEPSFTSDSPLHKLPSELLLKICEFLMFSNGHGHIYGVC